MVFAVFDLVRYTWMMGVIAPLDPEEVHTGLELEVQNVADHTAQGAAGSYIGDSSLNS